MQRDQIISMQEELHVFVVQTQYRLARVQKSIRQFKEAGASNAEIKNGSANLGGQSTFEPLNVEVAQETEFEAIERTRRPKHSPTTEKELSTKLDECELPQSSNAADRLEAIKRKLADQIGKT